MDVYLARTDRGLAAYDDESKAVLRKIKIGDIVRVSISRLRNAQFHRRFMNMVRFVYNSCGHWVSVDDLLMDLKFRVGHVDRHQVIDFRTGEKLAEIITPKSIAFHAMGQDDFQHFVDRCITVICEQMVPGLEDHVLREEVLRAVA